MRTLLIILTFSLLLSCSVFKKVEDRSPSSEESSDFALFSPENSFKQLKNEVENVYQNLVYEKKVSKARNCMRSICGKEDSNFSPFDVAFRGYSKFFYKPDSPLYKKIHHLLWQHILENSPRYSEEVKVIEEVVEKGHIEVSQSIKRMGNAMFLFKIWAKLLIKKYEQGELKHLSNYYDFPVTHDDLEQLKLPKKDHDWIHEGMSNGYFKVIIDAYSLQDLPFNVYLKRSYPLLKTKGQAISTFLNECSSNRKKVLKSFGFPESVKSFRFCDDIKQLPKNIPFDEDRLYEEFKTLKIFSLFDNESYSEFLSSREINLQKQLENYLASEAFALKRKLAKKNYIHHPKIKKVLKECHDKIGYAIEVSGSRLRRKKAQEFIRDIRRASKKIINFKFLINKMAFNRKIDAVDFALPLNRTRLINYISSSFKEEIETTKQDRKIFESPKFRLTHALITLIFDSSPEELDSNGDPNDLYSSTVDICNRYSLGALSDHIYTSSGAAYISWVPVNEPQYGVGIMAHEMGHYVSKVLTDMGASRKGKFYQGLPENIDVWEKKSCLNQIHESPGLAKGQYVEEDWADFFSGKIVKELSKDKPWLKNFGCVLLKEHITSGYSTDFTQNKSSSHSFGLFRLLNIEKSTHEDIPNQCHDLVDNLDKCY